MQRQNFPLRRSNSILLYGFGLALFLSLLFNGFLVYEQNRRSFTEYESADLVQPVEQVLWLQQLSDCKRANLQKDSLIRQLAQGPNAPPDRAIIVHLHSTK